MVLEYVGGGDCQQLLRSSRSPQSEPFIAKLIRQLLSVLTYCHERGILHCDIKPENMMLTQRSARGLPDLKVIDFGLTHRIDQPSRDFVGTPSYMAPEIVKGTVAYTIKADIWSAGVTACELLASKCPFDRPSDYGGKIDPVLDNIRNYRRFQEVDRRLSSSESWSSRSSCAKDFIQSLVIADPADRPHAAQALEHDWIIRNKDRPTSVSANMLTSMMKFMGASTLMRRCLLIIAARVGSPKMEQIGGVFLSIDDKHTGTISREDLASAVSAAATCWEPEFDVDDFFDAADQDRKEVISYLEFAAACLWGTDDTTNTIAERAFKALDDNHNGMVHLDDVRHLFRNFDPAQLHNLPQNRAFGIHEWRVAVGGSDQPLKPEQPEKSMIARFIRALICSDDNTGAEEDNEMVCR
jgi:calcium-dependent protein kinase